MSPSATEVKPQPYLIDCSVRNDPVAARTLLVKPVEPVSGHAGQAWRQAWRAQVLADERGQYDYVQAFYAGLELVAVYSEADPMLPLLRFTFQVGDTDYEKLAYRKGLSAQATVDLNSHRFTAVRFKHRSA